MGVGARCFQCKEKVQGLRTGRDHASATGHTWQPGYYCTDCEKTFASHTLCKQHIKEAGVHGKAIAPKTSLAASTPHIPSKPIPAAIGVPRPNISLLSTSGAGIKAGDGASPLQCTICRPPATFSSKESLEQHLAQTSTCTKCSIHFFEAEKLQDHYRTTAAHPTCRECGDGFPNLSEWATHRARCPPPVPVPPLAGAASSTQSTSAPRSTSDGFSLVSAEGSDDLSRCDRDTAIVSGLSEVRSVAPSSPPVHHVEVAWSHGASSDSMSTSDGISVARDTLETPVPPEDECPNTHVLRDRAAPLLPDKGKGKALSSSGVATPTTSADTATTTLEGSQRPDHKTAAKPQSFNLSFHCRSCLADPCVKPVATLCGHIFCHRCIVHELKTKMSCPVCQRPFFVRLDVGVAGS